MDIDFPMQPCLRAWLFYSKRAPCNDRWNRVKILKDLKI